MFFWEYFRYLKHCSVEITQERAYDPSWFSEFYTEKEKAGSLDEVFGFESAISAKRSFTYLIRTEFLVPKQNIVCIEVLD